jgi:hypothetical protein
MAILKGKDADVKVGGSAGTSIKSLVTDLTLDEGPETADITGFGDANRKRTDVVLDWSLRMTTFLDWSNSGLTTLRDAAEAGNPVTMAIYEDATNYRQGTAFVSKSEGIPVAGVQTIDWTFEANGALTRT